MKSAYELAMEKLANDDPEATQSLTASQKQALAEVDRTYDAKIAEKEIFLRAEIDRAETTEREALETQLQREKERLNDEREQQKDVVRQG